MGNFTGAGVGGGGGGGASGGGHAGYGSAATFSGPAAPDETHRSTMRWDVAHAPDPALEHALARAAKAGCHEAAKLLPAEAGCKAQGEIHPRAGGHATVIVHVTHHAAQLDGALLGAADHAFREACEASMRESGLSFARLP